MLAVMNNIEGDGLRSDTEALRCSLPPITQMLQGFAVDRLATAAVC